MEKEIKMAATLYRCRDTVKNFFKEEYEEKIAPFKKIITDVAKYKNTGELEAMMEICDDEVISGWTLIILMAATVEILEPATSN